MFVLSTWSTKSQYLDLSHAKRHVDCCVYNIMFFFVQAPDWVDAEECHRCRVQFGVMTRKVGGAFLESRALSEFMVFPPSVTTAWLGLLTHALELTWIYALGVFSTTVVPADRSSAENVHRNTRRFQSLASRRKYVCVSRALSCWTSE